MVRELRLLAWKSWRDVRVRLGVGLVVLLALVGLGFGARAAVRASSAGTLAARLDALVAEAGASADDLSGYLRFWWHEGGPRPALAVLAALLGCAGPVLDGRASRRFHAALPVPSGAPAAVHGLVACAGAAAASGCLALVTLGASLLVDGAWPLSEAVAMAVTGLGLSLPGAAVGLVSASYFRSRVAAALAALTGLWALSRLWPLPEPWSPRPAPPHDAWPAPGHLVPWVGLALVLFSLALARSTKARP